MQENKLMPNTVTYTSLMHGYIKTGNTQEVFALFDEMKKNGIKPDELTYGLMVDAHCKEGNLLDAFELRDEILQKGMPVTSTTYDALIDAVSEKEDSLKHSVCLMKWENKDLSPHLISVGI
ncbi:hypothetical protein C5167_006696 [Papaver somniferum]|uniref:Pentacotripeptide-repeat region of PRORP domain-containing protein n=1 Tax=Papaver somniferum TaxID=3469 RepID=A0A4Y7JE71_PAPSO|nr:hypothetical protein C5167_006696 [Papaver somniferum]